MDWGKIAATVAVKVGSKLLGGSKKNDKTATTIQLPDWDTEYAEMRKPNTGAEAEVTPSVDYNKIVQSWADSIYSYGRK